MDETAVEHVNRVASFLADEQVEGHRLAEIEPVDCIVLCGSAILHCAETVFLALRQRPTLTKTLVICGGIGHSTSLLYDAVARHPRYGAIRGAVEGLPESKVLYKIFEDFFDAGAVRRAGCEILIEDRSTNCGANAIESRKVLDAAALRPATILIVQDPTMSLRTSASFEKAFGDASPKPTLISCPTFVPKFSWDASTGLVYDVQGVETAELWSVPRFCDLLLGEIPRLRDDPHGYGPNGKGFIAHVSIPAGVEASWNTLRDIMQTQRMHDVSQ